MNVTERKKNRKGQPPVNNMEHGEFTPSSSRASIKGDEKNIALLFFLYTLQGIPLGLSAAIPLILQNRGVSYKQQAEFSFVWWPFSLKLLWAPLVDAIYSSRIGRRKTWLIPTQYLIGAFMLLLASHVNRWLGVDGGTPNIEILTVLFFLLNFLAATQDIAVDGWALTMLKKENVGHASTCNSVGQTTGYFMSNVLFMALESPTFCNQYLRSVPQEEGIVTFTGFLYFWGWVFLITTTLVAIFKTETEPHHPEQAVVHDRDIKTAYTSLKEILQLRSIQTLVILLLTTKIGFSSTDSVMPLKLVEAGIPKEKLGLIAIPLIPIQVVMPLIISKYTTGPKPLDVYLKAIPYRLLLGVGAALLVWITPTLVPDASEGLPVTYVGLLLILYAAHQVCLYCMYVSIMAFFAKISDSKVGGTYMTLLNTCCNLGGNWPTILALYFVDPLTWKQCVGGAEALDNTCRTSTEKDLCVSKGGKCVTTIDGFYVETVICIVIGFLWLSLWGKKTINYIQTLNDNAWKLNKRKTDKR
ncbi:unnamed protein product [Callosobruchus maculatus]|uniref:Major facilitator superfamily (MFS) profile domain-containing protein n=1 Tax=Callosobruchus maculatus TaxID=64391 RepID=A0A653D1Q5_CALMS|nr:unnamed protein product [Callosobruchus maculatus]